jgi:hypothetical protein
MPFRVRGKTIQKKVKGRWRVMVHNKSHQKALAELRYLKWKYPEG